MVEANNATETIQTAAVVDFVPEEELTGEQIDRQGETDNAIYQLVNSLVPAQYRKNLPEGEPQFEWDIEWLANLREEIQDVIFNLLELPDEKREQFEMNFYPWIKNEEEE